jgi:predicted PurR-regulated permease PerM
VSTERPIAEEPAQPAAVAVGHREDGPPNGRPAETPEGARPAPAPARAATGADAARAPAWLRASSDWTVRLFVVAFGVVALVYALGTLKVVVLPVIVALLVTTLLLPPTRALRRLGVPDGLAAALSMLGLVLVLGAVGTAIAPSVGGQLDDLRTGVEDGVRDATDILARPPFNLSEAELDDRVDRALAGLRENSGTITRGLQSGAVVVGEVLTGLILTVLLTFFFLSDGRRMWNWIVGLVGGGHRRELDEVGGRIFAALSGYVRGIALVGLVDALLIGLALVVLGVPLVVPLMVITFLAAFVPLIGAFLAGLAAVLIALVSNGLLTAALVLGAIILVQQVEGHLLYPLLMSRTVHLHPAVILLALAVGGIVAGIIGVFLAVPVAGVVSVIINYLRDRPKPQPPLAQQEAAVAR